MQQKEFASLTSRSIGRGAVAPSQTLPGGPPPPATTGKDGDTITENPKTVSRKELERTATTGKDSDNRPIKGSAHETDEIVR